MRVIDIHQLRFAECRRVRHAASIFLSRDAHQEALRHQQRSDRDKSTSEPGSEPKPEAQPEKILAVVEFHCIGTGTASVARGE